MYNWLWLPSNGSGEPSPLRTLTQDIAAAPGLVGDERMAETSHGVRDGTAGEAALD